MTRPIDIRPHDLETVKSILRAALPPDATAWVFGARVTGTTKPSSDLDLAIDAPRRREPPRRKFVIASRPLAAWRSSVTQARVKPVSPGLRSNRRACSSTPTQASRTPRPRSSGL
jgi:DNA polymerase sigma